MTSPCYLCGIATLYSCEVCKRPVCETHGGVYVDMEADGDAYETVFDVCLPCYHNAPAGKYEPFLGLTNRAT